MARADKVGAAQQFATAEGLLVLLSAVIHAVVVPDHLEEYWLRGVLLAVSAGQHAAWTGRIFAGRVTPRVPDPGGFGNTAPLRYGRAPRGFVDRA